MTHDGRSSFIPMAFSQGLRSQRDGCGPNYQRGKASLKLVRDHACPVGFGFWWLLAALVGRLWVRHRNERALYVVAPSLFRLNWKKVEKASLAKAAFANVFAGQFKRDGK